MPYIDMANIACGFHASDPLTMTKTVKLAVEHGVSIGAHPSYPDLVGFGRRDMQVAPDELEALLIYQIGALNGICQVNGAELEYVKPHGALYNKMLVDDQTLTAVINAVKRYSQHLPLVTLATPDHERLTQAAQDQGVQLWFEAFSDRAYTDEGKLAPRSMPGAVHKSDKLIEQQVMEIVNSGQVTTLSGRSLPIKADTICVHGDSEQALATVKRLHALINT